MAEPWRGVNRERWPSEPMPLTTALPAMRCPALPATHGTPSSKERTLNALSGFADRAGECWGELYSPEVKAKAGRKAIGGDPQPINDAPTLKDMGVTKTQSVKWQALAAPSIQTSPGLHRYQIGSSELGIGKGTTAKAKASKTGRPGGLFFRRSIRGCDRSGNGDRINCLAGAGRATARVNRGSGAFFSLQYEGLATARGSTFWESTLKI